MYPAGVLSFVLLAFFSYRPDSESCFPAFTPPPQSALQISGAVFDRHALSGVLGQVEQAAGAAGPALGQ